MVKRTSPCTEAKRSRRLCFSTCQDAISSQNLSLRRCDWQKRVLSKSKQENYNTVCATHVSWVSKTHVHFAQRNAHFRKSYCLAAQGMPCLADRPNTHGCFQQARYHSCGNCGGQTNAPTAKYPRVLKTTLSGILLISHAGHAKRTTRLPWRLGI